MTPTPTTEDEARALLLTVERGCEVVVIRGRKVPLGTRGTLRWQGDGQYGARAGLSVDGSSELTYTALKNIEGVWPGIPPGDDPEEGWLALWHRQQAQRVLPQKGHFVRHLTNGTEGRVFWAEGTRLGYGEQVLMRPRGTPPGPDGGKKGLWACANEVTYCTPGAGGPFSVYVPQVVAVPALAMTPPTFVDDRRADVPAAGVSHLPEPFSNIREVVYLPEQNVYKALDADGRLIAHLPRSTYMEIANLVSGR